MKRGVWLMVALLVPGAVQAAELKVLTSGAFRAALVAMAPLILQQTGHRLHIDNETAGGVAKRVGAGEALDLIVLPPSNAAGLGAAIGPARPLARVGIGMAVKDGAPRPAVGTVDEVRAVALASRAPAWIDPAAGGSSGIYMAGLWAKWGIADQLAPKAVLVHGGLVSDKLRSGEADLAFQQLSELTGVPGVVVLGPLPAAIQSYTVYAGAVPAKAAEPEAARQVLDWLAGPLALPVLQAKGMEAP